MSSSSISWSADATVRYERLAAEYSKLRANANVLKTGVLQEREKSQKLAGELQTSETSLRKVQAENESLLFRNDQLTKRVIALQEELENSKKKDGKKEKSSKKEISSAIEADYKNKIGLLEEELQNKMTHNMKLIEQINELELLHAKEIMELSEKFGEQMKKLEVRLDECHEQNADLEKKLAKQSENSSLREVETAVVSPFSNVQVTPEEEATSNVESLLVISPPKPEAYRLCCESARLCMSAVSTFLHLYSERTTLFPFDSSLEPVPAEIQSLTKSLSEASTKAHNLAMFLQDLLNKDQFELNAELVSFKNVFLPFAGSVRELRNGFVVLQTAETRGTWSNGQLDRMTESFTGAVHDFCGQIEALLRLMETFDFQKIAENLQQLATIIKGLKDSYYSRWRLESQLPIATKKFKCVGGALSNCLNQLGLETERLASRFDKTILVENEQSTSTTSPISSSSTDERVEIVESGFESEASALVPKIASKSLEVGSLKAMSHIVASKTSSTSSEGTNSTQNLEMTCERQRSRITELETEREHLLVEIALLKRKAERAREDPRKTSETTSQPPAIEPNASVDEGGEAAVVKHFYMERLSETFAHLQLERDRAKHLTAECTALLRRTMVAEDDRKVLEDRLKTLNLMKVQVEDELVTVRRGYEAQMGELTAHVAELNARTSNGEPKNGQPNGTIGNSPRSSFARKLLFQK